ncbi:MAG: RNA polymerase sigma factor [Bacteroidales bacterium]|nr:RNA polymerase sigma factor [Bacteroidales bacterium]MDY0217258.1 RNA polymerase sigma factor [Bacteroidales bacterium]
MTTIEFNTQLLNIENHLQQFAYSLTNNEDDAKDLVQDTLLKAITNQEKYENDTNLKAWTFTIMKNTFINNYRRKMKSNTLIDTTDDLYFINTSSDNPVEIAESKQAAKEIVKAIKKLEPEQRKPFEMHVAGFKYKEIADHMEISIGTVKSRIFFTRKKLMSQLHEYNN